MNNVIVRGGTKLQGQIVIPPSKSLSHRSIIAAGLAKGTSIVSNLIESKDIKVTLQSMKQLGSQVNKKDNNFEIKGNDGLFQVSDATFDCHESGSTLRFMIPIAMLSDEIVTFVGTGQLVYRPLTPYFEIFDKIGVEYTYDNQLPLSVSGNLLAGRYEIPGNVSSQFITGLLFALPLLDGESEIVVTSHLESKGYIDLTLDVLRDFGIEVEVNNQTYKVKGNQTYMAADYRVEGDYSQVAFWVVAGLLNGEIDCLDMNKESSQGDKELLDIVSRMGAELKFDEDVIKVTKTTTKSTVIDGSQCPDIIPVLTVLAAVSSGTTEVINAGRLRIKECDRLKAITSELNKLGANITETENGLIIQGVDHLVGAEVDGWNDHRIVMSMAVASLVTKGEVKIKGANAITKSYPHFFEQFKSIGGQVSEWNLET
jgi:3-phosphoshikimate 1-carboxyvinyltransferase